MGGKVYKLLQDVTLGDNMKLKLGQEIEIVNNVVYINGFMVQTNLQQFFMNWIKNNPSLFKDDTRIW